MRLRNVLSTPSFFCICIIKRRCCIYWFFWIHKDNYMVFLVNSINVIKLIDFFILEVDVVMIQCLFYIFLDSVSWHFVENFCDYIHERDLSTLFISCNILVRFWHPDQPDYIKQVGKIFAIFLFSRIICIRLLSFLT